MTFYALSHKSMILIIVFLVLILLTGMTLADEESLPFQPGEKFTFHISWGGLSIGEAFLEVLPYTEIQGKPSHHFVLGGKTAGVVDIFYRVHTRIEAFTDKPMTRSVFFKNKISGRHNKLIIFHFDWEKAQVLRTENGRKRDPVSLLPGSFDLLSIFYFSRLQDLRVNTVYEHPITDGKKNVMGRMKIAKREIIEVAGKEYDTLLLEPETRHIGGVFKKSTNPKIQLWVTADKRRIPVRARSEVVVGSFVGELISAEGVL